MSITRSYTTLQGQENSFHLDLLIILFLEMHHTHREGMKTYKERS